LRLHPFRKHYRKPFEGKIYLPRFCVRNGAKEAAKLDYFQHLVSRVDPGQFPCAAVDWDLTAALAAGKDVFYRITLNQDDAQNVGETAPAALESDEQVKAWLVTNLPFDYFSQKQLREVVNRVIDRLYAVNPGLAGKLALAKFEVRAKTVGFFDRETDRQTEAAFKKLFDAKKLAFYLECVECRFEIPEQVEVRAMKQLAHDNGDLMRCSLFDFIGDDLNDYERSVALFLDRQPQVLWWYRNLVGPENFSIQGYRRNLIYPDFVVQEGQNGKPLASVLVLEGKGEHLKGNEDTLYKCSVANYFEKAGRKVSWQKLGEEFESHRFRFQIVDQGEHADQDWRDELRRLLEGNGEHLSGKGR
jgi:type III restriction enzyme